MLEVALVLPCRLCSWWGLQLVGQARSSSQALVCWGIPAWSPCPNPKGDESISQAPLEIPRMPSQECLTSELALPDREEELSFKNRNKISTRPKHTSPVCLFKLIPAEKAVPPAALSDRNFVLRSPCELWQRSKRCFKTNTELMSRGAALGVVFTEGKMCHGWATVHTYNTDVAQRQSVAYAHERGTWTDRQALPSSLSCTTAPEGLPVPYGCAVQQRLPQSERSAEPLPAQISVSWDSVLTVSSPSHETTLFSVVCWEALIRRYLAFPVLSFSTIRTRETAQDWP